MKRILSLFLCFVLLFSMVPVSAFAEETDATEVPENTEITEPQSAEAAAITVKVRDLETVYNGCHQVPGVDVISGSLLDGHYLEIDEFIGGSTRVTETPVTVSISGASVRDTEGNDVSDRYDITLVDGSISIGRADLTVGFNDVSYPQSGRVDPDFCNSFQTYGLQGSDKVNYAFRFYLNGEEVGSPSEVGEYQVELYDVQILNNLYEDVTDCYNLTTLTSSYTVTEDDTENAGSEGSGGADSGSSAPADNISWSYADGVLTINDESVLSDYSVSYGSTGPNVVNPWDEYEADITSIVIEEGITYIGNYAFFNHSAAGTVSLPSTLKQIGTGAFQQSGLTSVTLPQGIESVGSRAFAGTAIDHLHIPASLSNVGSGSILNCLSFEGFTVAAGHEYYLVDDNGILFNADKTKLVQFLPNYTANNGIYAIPEGVANLQVDAFTAVAGLTEITIPSTLTDPLVATAFNNCRQLQSIGVNTGNTEYSSLDGVLFNKDRSELYRYPTAKQGQSYTIPDTISEIRRSSFSESTVLESLTIPATVTTVQNYAFGSSGISEFIFEGSAPAVEEGFPLPFNMVTATACYPANDASWTEEARTAFGGDITWQSYEPEGDEPSTEAWSYADGVLTINDESVLGDYTVSHGSNGPEASQPWDEYETDITSVVIAEGVTSIGNYAFCGLRNALSITLPSTLESIGDGAFYFMSSLSQITLPEGLRTIGNEAFNATRLVTLTLPDGLESIGVAPCFNNPVFEGFVVSENSVSFYADARGVLYSKDKTDLHQAPNVMHGAYTAESTTQRIRNRAFDFVSGLTELELPASISYFIPIYKASDLERVTITEGGEHYCSVDGVVYNANRTQLVYYPDAKTDSSYDIPESVETIFGNSFMGNAYLESVTIPASVSYVYGMSFTECSGLDSITFMGAAPEVQTGVSAPFTNVTATAYYPANDASWTEEAKAAFGGNITWVAYSPDSGEESEGNISWKLENGKLTIRGEGPMPDYDVENYNPAPWYSSRDSISAIVISQGVTTIGDWAFADLVNVSSVSIPYGITAIGQSAFSNCIGLSTVILPPSLETIGAHAFYGCENFRSTDVPPAVTSVGNFAYQGSGITALRFVGSAPSIGANAFHGLTLTVTYPADDGSYTMGNMLGYGGIATWQPYGATTLYAGAVTTTMNWAITSDGALTISGSGVMPDYVDAMGNASRNGAAPWAPYYESVTKVCVLYGVENVGSYAFSNLTKATQLLLASSVSDVDPTALQTTMALASIYVDANNPCLSTDANGALYNANKTVLIRVPHQHTGSFTVPSTVTSIGERAFDSAMKLTTVSIPASVTSIGSTSFIRNAALESFTVAADNAYYSSLDGVLYNKNRQTLVAVPGAISGDFTVPEGVVALGDYAISYNADISSISLPEGLTSIGTFAFVGGFGLGDVELPASVSYIGRGAFASCDSAGIYFTGDAPSFHAEAFLNYNGTAYYPEGNDSWTEEVRQNYGSSSMTWESYKYEGDGSDKPTAAWEYKDGVLTIYSDSAIPDYAEGPGLKTHPWDEFNDEITSVVVKEGVTRIGGFGLSYLYMAESITLPEGLKSIGDYAFMVTSSLETLHLPASLESYGINTLHSSGLSSFTVAQGNEYFTADEKGVLYTKDMSELVQFLPGYEGEYTIPAGVTTIRNRAFANMNNVTALNLPSTLSEILGNQFPMPSLTAVSVAAGNNSFTAVDGVLFSKDMKELKLYPAAKSGTSYTVPAGVETIQAGAFAQGNYGSPDLDSISFPASLKYIEGLSFYNASNISEIHFAGGAVSPVGTAPALYDLAATAYYPAFMDSWTEEARTDLGGNITWVDNGAVGEENFWHFADNTLTIFRNTPDYNSTEALPWASVIDDIHKVIVCEGVKSIGSSAFNGADKLSSVSLPSTLESIGTISFAACTGLERITLPVELSTIKSGAFVGSGIKSFAVAEGNTYFSADESGVLFNKNGSELIRMVEGMEEYSIPQGVTSVRTDAFDMVSDLRVVNIPASLTEVDEVFNKIFGLTAITVDPNNRGLCAVDGVLFSESMDRLICYPIGKPGDSYAIPGTVKTIAARAMSDSSLTSITVSESVTSIGAMAFSHGRGFETVIRFEGKAPAIAANIFSGRTLVCEYPENLSGWTSGKLMPYGAAMIDWQPYEKVIAQGENDGMNWRIALDGTLYLEGQGLVPAYDPAEGNPAPWHEYRGQVKSIHLGAGYNGFGGVHTFDEHENISAWKVASDSSTFKAVSGILYSIDGSILMRFPNEKTGSFTVPNTVKHIIGGAFRNTSLTTLVIPASVETLGAWTISNSDSLKTLTLNEGLQRIHNGAISGLMQVESLSIPESVTYIGVSGISDLASLSSISFGHDAYSDLTIEDGAFTAYTESGILTVKVPDAANIHSALISYQWKDWGLTPMFQSPGAVSGVCGDSLYWAVSGNTLNIFGSGEMYAFEGSAPWDAYAEQIERIIVNNGVGSVSSAAFQTLSNTKNLIFTGSQPDFADDAFSGISANAYCMPGISSWDMSSLHNFGGSILWKPVAENQLINDVEELILSARYLPGEKYVVGSITLTENIVLDSMEKMLVINEGGSITVPSGKTLTAMGGVNLLEGSLTVAKGGTLEYANLLVVQNDSVLTISGTKKGDGNVLQWHGSTVTGINKNQIAYCYNVYSDADIRAAIKLSGYMNVQLYIRDADIHLQSDLTLPAGKMLLIGGFMESEEVKATVTVPAGLSLTNNGSITIFADGRLIFEQGAELAKQGNIVDLGENGIVFEQGSETEAQTSVTVYTYEQFRQALENAPRNSRQNRYFVNVKGSFDIPENIDIPYGVNVVVNGEYTVTVKSGNELKVRGELGLSAGAKLIVESGAQLKNFYRITAFDRAGIDNQGHYMQNGNATLECAPEIVLNGIDHKHRTLSSSFSDVAELKGLLEDMNSLSFHKYELYNIGGGIGLDREVELPENVDLYLVGSRLDIVSGGKLTTHGQFYVQGGTVITVHEDGSLINEGQMFNFDSRVEYIGSAGGLGHSIHEKTIANEAELRSTLTEGYGCIYISGAVTINSNITIPDTVTLIVPDHTTLAVKAGKKLINNGEIILRGRMNIFGSFSGNPIDVDGGRISAPEGSYRQRGRTIEDLKVSGVESSYGKGVPVVAEIESVGPGAWDTGWYWDFEEGVFELDEQGRPVPRKSGRHKLYLCSNDGAVTKEFDIHIEEYYAQIYHNGQALPEGASRQFAAGESLTLSAQLLPGNHSGSSVVWSVDEQAQGLVTVKSSKNDVTLTAADISERKTLTLTAASKDGFAEPATVKISIVPRVQTIRIMDADGVELNGDTVIFNLNRADRSYALQIGYSPEDAVGSFTVSSENEKIVRVDENNVLHFTGNKGSAKITVTARDSGKVKAVFTVKADYLPTDISFVESKREITGGESLQLQVENDTTGKLVDASQLVWFMEDGAEGVAEVNEKGLVTSCEVSELRHVMVKAAVLGDEEKTVISCPIAVYPRVQDTRIFLGDKDKTAQTVRVDIAHITKDDLTVAELTAAVQPADAMQKVTWKTSNNKILHVEDGKLIGVWDNRAQRLQTGTVTVTATSVDDPLHFAEISLELGIFPKEMKVEAHETELRSGKSLTFRTSFEPANTTETGFFWSLADSRDADFVTLTEKGMLTAKTVYEQHEVQLRAVSTADPRLVYETTITVKPKVDGQLILKSGEEYITRDTLYLNVGESLVLTPVTEGFEDEPQPVKWKSSNKKVANVEDGVLTVYGKGKTTITATDANNSKRSASFTIVASVLSTGVEIAGAEQSLYLSSGKSMQLKATVLPKDVGNKSVRWYLEGDGAQYAVLSASGKLTARTVKQPVTVQVTAEAADGNSRSSVNVQLLPITDSIEILLDGQNITGSAQNWDKTGAGFDLGAAIYPATADKDIDWKSSNTRIATVDENGHVHCLMAGTVTISAEASDGSKVKASFKLTVTSRMESLLLTGGPVGGGKKLTVAAHIYPADTTNKKLSWSIEGPGAAFASISQSGVITTRKVSAPIELTVRAAALDGSSVEASSTVTIWPVATKVVMRDASGAAAPKSLSLFVNDSVKLGAGTEPFAAADEITWRSSNTKIATVDAEGNVTAIKAGSATIYATAADGSGKSASISIKVTNPVSSIDLGGDKVIAGGKKLSMKAVVDKTASNKKLVWSISGDTGFASINQGGNLTTKKVTEPKTVIVTVSAQDGSGKYAQCTVTIYPETMSIDVKNGEEIIDGKTLDLQVGQTQQVQAVGNPDNCAQRFTWKSSNTKLVSVDEDGRLTALKAGKVDITVTAADGSNEKTSFKVTVSK